MLTKSDWGFILMQFIVCNGLTWLCDSELELDLKEKIILPNIIILALIGIMIAFKLMGVGA